MLKCRIADTCSKGQWQECKRQENEDEVDRDLQTDRRYSTQKMRINVAADQHHLKKQDTSCPHGGSTAEIGKDHLPDHWLTPEQEKGTGKERDAERPHEHSVHSGRQAYN